MSQPNPIPNTSEPIVDLVIKDLQDRKKVGIERYGAPLQANNGRDALQDVYEELLDAVQYIRQVREEDSNERKILIKLISHLLSHNQYGYQCVDRVKKDLRSAGWDEGKILLTLKFSDTKEWARPEYWEKEFL